MELNEFDSRKNIFARIGPYGTSIPVGVILKLFSLVSVPAGPQFPSGSLREKCSKHAVYVENTAVSGFLIVSEALLQGQMFYSGDDPIVSAPDR